MDKYRHANLVLSKFSHEYVHLLNDLPIRPSEMGVVNIIVHYEEKLTPLAIAKILSVSKTMVAMHVASLEREGYIKKEPSIGDKRSFFVLPTEKAKKLSAQVEERQYEKMIRLENAMGNDMFEALVTLVDWAQKTIF